jgi:ribosome-associated heat shock protein Hsp15
MPPDSQRLDKWLWFARLAKSRTLAARLVEEGHVRVNRVKADKPANPVKPGDVLTLSLGSRILVLRVMDPGTRRGPALEARGLYEEVTE